MEIRHIFMVLIVTLGWGFNFIVMKFGLQDLPPYLFLFLRFTLTVIPAIFLVPRPKVPLPLVLIIGLCLGFGQITLLLLGLHLGMPAGLSSVVLQSQAFFTVILAAFMAKEIPHLGQMLAMIVAFIGIALVGMTVMTGNIGVETPSITAFSCVILGAIFFAIGNVLVKTYGANNVLGLVVWSSAASPVPLLLMTLTLEGPDLILSSLQNISWKGITAVMYSGLFSSILCGTLWGKLFVRYPASLVAPFSLLIPVFALILSSLFLKESLSETVLLASTLVIIGLVLNQLPKKWFNFLRFGAERS